MKKTIVLLGIMALIAGCGVTNPKDGSDGSNGANGQNGGNGRDFITPVVRDHTWDTTNTVLFFDDTASATSPILYSLGFAEQDTGNNFVQIKIPAGNQGKKIRAVINGIVSSEIIVPLNVLDYITFNTSLGSDTSTTDYMNCSKIDWNSKDSYFTWYVDNIQQEMYFADAFEGGI